MRKIMTDKEIRRCLREMRTEEEDDQDDDPSAFVNVVRDSFAYVGFDVKRIHCEQTGELMYGLVNVEADEVAKKFPSYQKSELDFFRRIVEKIVDRYVPIRTVRNVRNAYPIASHSFTKFVRIYVYSEHGSIQMRTFRQEAEQASFRHSTMALQRWVLSGWLALNQAGVNQSVFVGTRTFVELPDLLQSLHCPTCPICGLHAVDAASPCSSCDVSVHRHCLSRVFARTNRTQCRVDGCDGKWSRPVGDQAESEAKE